MEEVTMEVVGGEGDMEEEEEDGGTIIIIMVGGAATTTTITTGDAGVVGGAGAGAGDHMDTLDTIGQYYNCLCVCFYELSIQGGLYREITNISFSLSRCSIVVLYSDDPYFLLVHHTPLFPPVSYNPGTSEPVSIEDGVSA